MFFEKNFMNKLLIFTTCITPLFLVSADAKFSPSNLDQNMEKSVKVSKPSDVKLDQYLRIKCNLPKISDQEIRNIAQNAIDAIADIRQRISVDHITDSLKSYCLLKDKKGEFNSVFGKAIEVAQDLVLVAKTYADFDNVVMLERISKEALDLYEREGKNFNALERNQIATPEYEENEALFKKFISKDLVILEQIALQYRGKLVEPIAPTVGNGGFASEPEKKAEAPVFETKIPAENIPVIKPDFAKVGNHSEYPMEKAIEPSSSMIPAADKEAIPDKDSVYEKNLGETNMQPNPIEPLPPVSVIAESKEEAQNIEKAEKKPIFDSEGSKDESNVAMDLNPAPIALEPNAEISKEKPIDINSTVPAEESKEAMPDEQKFNANSDIKSSEEPEANAFEAPSNETTESSQTVNNEEAEGNPLSPHYFSGKSSEPTKLNEEETPKVETSSSEQKEPSEERKSFWGF